MVKDSGYEKLAAPTSMQRYLLPCSCSHRIPVAAAQAGGKVRCPDCGAERDVPRLGELSRLEVAAVESPSAGAGWGAAQACLMAGIVAVAVGLSAAVWLRALRSAAVPLDERAIRESAAVAPADEIHRSWLVFERQGIVRPPFAEEQRMLRQARMLSPLETGAWIVAGIGGAVAAAAFIAAGSRR